MGTLNISGRIITGSKAEEVKVMSEDDFYLKLLLINLVGGTLL